MLLGYVPVYASVSPPCLISQRTPFMSIFPVDNTHSKTFSRKRRRRNSTSPSSLSRFKCSIATPPSLPYDIAEFVEASKTGNLVPLFRCIFSDHLTPVLAFQCLVKEGDWETPSFLFDSFDQGFQDSILGRYSVVGSEPSVEIVAKERWVTIIDHHEGRRTEVFAEDPMGIPQRIMEGWTPQLTHQLPDTFCAYDIAEFVEASKTGNLVPLFRCIFSDHLTPVLAFQRLVKEGDWETPSFLFDSFDQGFQDSILGRYSVVGSEPSVEIVAKERWVTIIDHHEGWRTEVFAEDPMGIPQRIMEGWTPQLTHQLPDTFCANNNAAKFTEASKNGNIIPLYRCIFSDQLTPVLAYRCLVGEDDKDFPSFLIESVEQSVRALTVGRYSVVGARPTIEMVASGNLVTVMDHEDGSKTEEFVEDPMEIPRKIMEGWKPQLIEELPEAFCGGWIGYFSYDTVRYVENKKLPFSNAPKDDRKLADIHLGLYDDVIVFDHVEKKAYVIHWVRLDRYSSVENAYIDGMNRLEHLVSRLQNNDAPRLSAGSVKLQTKQFGSSLKKSTMTSEAYKKAVLQAKQHILSGDIFQIVLSQRFERRTFADPFEVYRALRVVNPSPYMSYLQARGCIIVSSSPEILTRVKKGKIINRPLAGTVRRGKTTDEDEMLEKLLLKDKKQCAEHVMLVDLGRNDVGKVSKPGSVKVEKLMNVERYSHVMHISSTVSGELLDGLSCWDVLRAALPVGTVSGAPKVKAMELIDQLEVTRRGPYSGGFGGISFTGDMDIALALRTIVFPTGPRHDTMYLYGNEDSRREWVAHLQAGAGIVADSVPDDEQKECENKAAALARAIDLAESTFVKK